MKRETVRWAKYQRDAGRHPSLGNDVLDSDARQRAETRRLRKALRLASYAMNSMGETLNAADMAFDDPDLGKIGTAFAAVDAALKRKR